MSGRRHTGVRTEVTGADRNDCRTQATLNGESWFPSGKSRRAHVVATADRDSGGIAGGLTNKHLARNLGITERTVKHHLTAIFDRLGTTRRAEAVSRAVEQGLIRLPRR